MTSSPLSQQVKIVPEDSTEDDQNKKLQSKKPPINPNPSILRQVSVKESYMASNAGPEQELDPSNLRGGLRLSTAQLHRVNSRSNSVSNSDITTGAGGAQLSAGGVAIPEQVGDFRSPPVNVLSTSDPYYNYFTDKSLASQDGTYWAHALVASSGDSKKHRLGSSERDIQASISRDSLHEVSLASKLADVLGAPATSESMANPRQQSLENGLAKELQDIFAALERCIEIRSSYMHASRQCPGGC